MNQVNKLILLAVAFVLLSAPASADPIIDPVGDFLSTYTGPRGGDLDVVSSQVIFTGTDFIFSATMNGAIGTTPGAFYVWGVDRGRGASTASFARLGLPNIVFDAVVVVDLGLGSNVNRLLEGINQTLPAGNVTFSGNTIEARVPLSFLPSLGLAFDQYEWNLWPRCCGRPLSDSQISDFAPNTTNARITSVPEPTTILLLGAGLAGVAAKVRRRNKVGKSDEA